MATTSLWHIEGRLKDLIAYVENPEKTRSENSNLQPLWDVFSYVSRPEATEQGEYVSADQLPQRDCLAADDFNEKAVRQGKRIYRMARLSKLQARRSHTRTGAPNRIAVGKGNVGRKVSDHRHYPP